MIHTTTRNASITISGIALRLEIEEDFDSGYGYPDDRIPVAGRVVGAEVMEIVDEKEAYRELEALSK